MPSEIIVVERALLKSKPFRTLGGNAKTVYFDFLMKCQWTELKTPSGRKKEWTISNNGQIEYTYSEGGKKGIPRATFMRTLDNLIDKGLIDITHSGSGTKGDKSTYAISERWKRWGKDDFIKKSRSKDGRQGRGFRPGWRKKKQKT